MRLTLAPAVWLVHFTFVYVVASVACERLVPAAAVATAAALLVFFATALLDYRRWRRLGSGPQAFVSAASVLVCALAAVATLGVAYPAFILPACAG